MAALRNFDYTKGMGGHPVLRLGLILAAVAALGLPACQKVKQAAGMGGGEAFLDSQIPPGLSPQYFPPQGFVWGAYRAGNLPQARYGVASPPTNPRAQVLVLADADYPAEAYFELTRQLIDEGYGVWLLEVPGQGGAGHYLLQNNAVYSPNFRDGETAAAGFIKDIIKPTTDKPLIVLGTGFSALNALALSTVLNDDSMGGFVAFDPYTGGPITKGGEWHREDVPKSYWGVIAQSWQTSNPDLRLRIKSEAWQKQVKKSYDELYGLHLPVIALKGSNAPVVVIEPRGSASQQANAASALCAHVPRCRMQATDSAASLGGQLADILRNELAPPGL